MDNKSYNDFNNICRTCMLTCDEKFTQDNVILNIFYKLTDIHFETCVELPQQICLKCFKKINEINEFAFQCKQTHSILLKCINNFKNTQINEEPKILEPKTEKITNDENSYVEDGRLNSTCNNYIDEFNMKQEIQLEEIMIPETHYDENLKCFDNDVLQANAIKIEVKHEDDSNSNENYINEDNSSNSFDSSSVDSAENNTEISKIFRSRKKNLNSERPYERKKSTSMTNHGPSYYDERPYKCDQCSKSYRKVFGLKVHMRTHSGERPYKCNQCPKSFAQRISLVQHTRTHTGERPYKCEVCSKTFSESSNLKKHMRIHSGERLYSCNLCTKSFSLLADSIRHMRMHNGVRPFKCKECPKAFSRSDTLKKHLLTHSGERPYTCIHCSQSFTQATNLTRHLRAHDSECSSLLQPEFEAVGSFKC